MHYIFACVRLSFLYHLIIAHKLHFKNAKRKDLPIVIQNMTCIVYIIARDSMVCMSLVLMPPRHVHACAIVTCISLVNSPSHGTLSEPERHRPVGTVPGSRGNSLQQRVGDCLPQPLVHRGRPGGMSHARVHLRIEGRHQRRLRARYGADMANQRHLCWQRGLHRKLLLRWVGHH